MYFCGKEKRDSGNWWKTCGMRDSREKGAGMRDQDPPFQTLLLAKWWCNFKPFTMYTFIFTSPVELFFHIKIIHWTLLYSFPPEKVLRIRHFRNCSYTKMKAPFSLLTLFTRREGDPGAMEWYGGPKITRCLFSMSSCLIVRSSCQFVMSSCLPVVYSCRFVMLSCVQNK